MLNAHSIQPCLFLYLIWV